MKAKYFISFAMFLITSPALKAQRSASDSVALVKTFKELLAICKNVDFKDTKTIELGTFYKAAPYILYRGDDKKREWKDFANYKNADEKKGVDEVCLRINGTVNRDSAYRIIKYFTEKESEGTWHVLMVSYKRNSIEKKAAFAFIKIGDHFGLGDID